MLGCGRLKFDRRFVALRGKPPEMPPETGEGLRVGRFTIPPSEGVMVACGVAARL